jgi:release factor glutamine methyltransferase
VRDRFRAAGIATPELDAKLLAQKAFGLDALALVAYERDPAPADALAMLQAFAARRLTGEPVARILGEQEFYGLAFGLNAATLVPRPETEMLVDLGLAFLAARPDGNLLDLGTGTGCIAIALLHEASQVRGVAVDLSPEALKMARVNAQRHGIGSRLDLRQGSWFEPIAPAERFDLVVANPPYIESAAIAGLQRDVRDFDPLLALDGGADGLAPYRIIAAQAPHHLSPGGLLAVEIGAGQGAAVAALFAAAGLDDIEIKNDLAGLDRVVIAHHS